MTRFVLWGGLAVIAVALACFYPMGGQPLIGHIAEVYRSPVVQKKVSALNSGVEKRAQEMGQNAKSLWDKKDHKPRGMRGAPMSRVERDEHRSEKSDRVERHSAPATDDKSDVRERPHQESNKSDNTSHSVPPKLAPTAKKLEPIQSVPDKPAPPATAKDDLTEQDRDGLNRLLADKLRKGS